MRLLKIAERCLLLACGIVLGRVLFPVRPLAARRNGNGRAARHTHRPAAPIPVEASRIPPAAAAAALRRPPPTTAPPLALNLLDGQYYRHHPSVLLADTSGAPAERETLVELNGLRVPAGFDCDIFLKPRRDGRKFWSKHHVFFEAPNRWRACRLHELTLRSGLRVEAPLLPLVDDEYAALAAVLQSVLRHEARGGAAPYAFAEIGARWGTWGARAAAFARKRGHEVALYFAESHAESCDGLRRVMALNGLTNATTLDCAKATRQRLLRWLATVDHVDVMHMDIQGDETALIPAILGILDEKVYRVVVRTHHADVHAQLGSHFAQRRWLVASDVPRQAQPECVWKYVRGNYKEESPHRFDWRALLREGCYVNTSRGPVAQSDGELILDNPRWIRQVATPHSRVLDAAPGGADDDVRLGTDDLRATPLAAARSGSVLANASALAARLARDPAAPALSRAVRALAKAVADPADQRFVFTISTRETTHWALNLVYGARRHGGVRVGVITLESSHCDELRAAAADCEWSGYTPETVGTRLTMAAGGAKGWNGKGGAYVNGYALTFAKFDVIRHAIEAGYSPTFIDADVAVTGAADLRAAIAATNLYDLYIAKGHGPRCSTTIDGFIHCGKDCVVGGAAWRVVARFADRKLSFDADPFAIWAQSDAQGLTAPPHTRTKFFRENLLLNDVLASECCAAPIYDAVVPSTPGRILDKRLVDAYLGRNISSEVEGGQFRRTTGCAELSYDGETRSWWRELPDGGTFAFAPDHFLRNFKDDWQSMQASEGLKFSVDPPALAHFVGAGAASTAGNIYKTEYMQGFGFWNYSVDAKAHQVWAASENGRQKGGPARDFNGMRSGKDLYFSLAFHGPRARRYLLLELAAWPADLAGFGRAWVAADRLAQALGRELVPWNVPCALGWSDRQLVVADKTTGGATSGLRAALVESRCDVGFDAGGGRPRRGANATCCTAFFDLADNKCGGLAEQIVACADPVHRRRFEQEVSAADLAAAVTVGEVRGLGGGAGPAVVRVRMEDGAAVSDALAAVEAAGPFRVYRRTASRGCAAGVCARAV